MKRVVMIAALVMISGCGGKTQEQAFQEAAEDAIRLQMVDPQSAQFELVEVGDKTVCGWVNGKNRMGGYAGRRPFIVHVSGTKKYAFAKEAILQDDSMDAKAFYRSQIDCPGAIGQVAKAVFAPKPSS